MKKKIFVITSIALIAIMMCGVFVGCKSAEEKEAEFYEKNALAVESATEKLSPLSEDVFSKSWTSSFVLAMTYYKTNVERTYKNGEQEKFSFGGLTDSPIKRGSSEVAGWPVKVVEKEDYTDKNSTDEYVTFMAFDIDYKSADNYTINTTLFKEETRGDYLKYISKKNYREKFTVEETLEFTWVDGEPNGKLYINPLELIKESTDKEAIRESGISASDNFRIYTHFMRIESRTVYGEDYAPITRKVNEESEYKYWKNYGDDISYNWDNVYGMNNNRLTVLYSKGKNRINSLEIYNENIISYFTKNNNVDKSLVLKADVIAYTEMVVEFKY